MGLYDRLIGIEVYTGERVVDRISPEVFRALMGEYLEGRLSRGLAPPGPYGDNYLAGQTATTVLTPSFTMEVGTTAVLLAHSEGSKIVSSVADAKGNTWTVDLSGLSGTDGMSAISAPITTEILASDNITITWSAAGSNFAHYALFEARGIVGYDTGVITDQATQDAAITSPTLAAEESAVLALIHSNDSGASFTVGATPLWYGDDNVGGGACAVRGATFTNAPVLVDGRWDVASTGAALIVAYSGPSGSYLPPLVERELTSPLTQLEHEFLRDRCDAVDAGGRDYIQMMQDILMLTHRETPGYRDQNEVLALL
jgi:hypothetical protein